MIPPFEFCRRPFISSNLSFRVTSFPAKTSPLTSSYLYFSRPNTSTPWTKVDMSNSKLSSVTAGEEKGSCAFLADKILKILECPICFEIPLISPIYQCILGHSFCAQCRSKVNQCGLCGKKFSRSRNYALESIIEAASFKCKFENQGCQEVFTGPMMSEHQKGCYFRPITCNDHRKEPCYGNPIDVNNFIRHLRTKHRCSGFDSELQVYEKWERSSLNKVAAWVLFFMKSDGRYFLKHTQTDDENIFWWLSIVGTPAEAENYYAIITVLSQPPTSAAAKKMAVKVEFTVPVHSFRDTFETVTTGGAGSCGIMPKSHLKRFCNVIRLRGQTFTAEQRYEWKMQFQILKKEVGQPVPMPTGIRMDTTEVLNGSETDESIGN